MDFGVQLFDRIEDFARLPLRRRSDQGQRSGEGVDTHKRHDSGIVQRRLPRSDPNILLDFQSTFELFSFGSVLAPNHNVRSLLNGGSYWQMERKSPFLIAFERLSFHVSG